MIQLSWRIIVIRLEIPLKSLLWFPLENMHKLKFNVSKELKNFSIMSTLFVVNLSPPGGLPGVPAGGLVGGIAGEGGLAGEPVGGLTGPGVAVGPVGDFFGPTSITAKAPTANFPQNETFARLFLICESK